MQAPDIGELAGKRRAALVWRQREFLQTIEHAPRYLDDDSIEKIKRAGNDYLERYVSYAKDQSTAWKLVRKVHTLAHLLEDMATGDRLNCKFFSGWTDETLMGKVITMVEDQDPRQALVNVLTAYWPMYVERARG